MGYSIEKRREYDKQYYLKNNRKIYMQEYRLKNKEKEIEKRKIYYENNKEHMSVIKRIYYLKQVEEKKKHLIENAKEIAEQKRLKKIKSKEIHLIKLKERQKRWRDKNPNYQKEYLKNKISTNPLFKLSGNIRCLIYRSLKSKGYTKKSKTYQILGCSFEDFKKHLESNFESWMTWENYGNWNGAPNELNASWDIDHIIPTSSAKTEDELIKLNNYTNLQPLCSYTNRFIKKNK